MKKQRRELVQSADRLQREVQRAHSKGLHPMLERLIASDLDKIARSLGHASAALIERQGERDQLILDLTTCMSEMARGDTVHGVLALALFQMQNLGPTGRFVASLATAARAGAQVDFVILVRHEEEGGELTHSVLAEQRRRIAEFDMHASEQDSEGAYEARVLVVDGSEYWEFVKNHGSFLLLGTSKGLVVVDADYDRSGGKCTAIRFGSCSTKNLLSTELSTAFEDLRSRAKLIRVAAAAAGDLQG